MESSPIRRILVPVDFSDPSRAALRFAYALAPSLGATVEVIHVIERSLGAPAVADEAELAESLKMMRELVATIGGREIPALRVETGYVHERIVATAEREHFDLIVMGTAGRTGRARSLAGSVAESVVRAAGCPVLTIREFPEPAPAGADAPQP